MASSPQSPLLSSSGQVITAAIVALLIIAIFIPLIVTYVRNEARWAIKQKQTTTAFHLAEGAVDRGIWKLTEEDSVWTDAKNGVTVTGYADDVEYTDISGGKYKIKFSSGPNSGEVTVRGKGQDTSTKELRVVEAVYTKASINAGLQIDGAMGYDPNLKVEWGPVVTFTSINQSPSDYFPRKYSKGQITGRDTVDDSNNTDNIEYWAFNRDLGNAPVVDLPYYKTQALASSIPTSLTSSCGAGEIDKRVGGTVAVASPTGSGYFLYSQNSDGLNFKKTGSGCYQFRNSTSVIYIDNDSGSSNQVNLAAEVFLEVEALVIAGAGLDNNAKNYSSFAATVPAAANLEYQHADAGTTAEWALFSTAWATGNHCCYNITGLGVHGFVYVGSGSYNAGAGAKVLGVVDMSGTLGNMNTTTVYFDSAIATNIHLKGGTPRRISWKEIKTVW